MAYIKKPQRRKFEQAFKDLLILDSEELNFAACQLFMRFIDTQEPPITYNKIAQGISALEEAAAEVRLRVLKGYQHQRRIESGDIFTEFNRKHNIREFS